MEGGRKGGMEEWREGGEEREHVRGKEGVRPRLAYATYTPLRKKRGWGGEGEPARP